MLIILLRHWMVKGIGEKFEDCWNLVVSLQTQLSWLSGHNNHDFLSSGRYFYIQIIL